MLELGRLLAVGSALILRTSLGAVANRARWVMTEPRAMQYRSRPVYHSAPKGNSRLPWMAGTNADRGGSKASIIGNFAHDRFPVSARAYSVGFKFVRSFVGSAAT